MIYIYRRTGVIGGRIVEIVGDPPEDFALTRSHVCSISLAQSWA